MELHVILYSLIVLVALSKSNQDLQTNSEILPLESFWVQSANSNSIGEHVHDMLITRPLIATHQCSRKVSPNVGCSYLYQIFESMCINILITRPVLMAYITLVAKYQCSFHWRRRVIVTFPGQNSVTPNLKSGCCFVWGM